jgi:ABC-type antimicrobial peptide transport system permease subunit
MVFGENVRIAAGGSMLGLIGALLASRVLASLLYATSTHDPWVLVASGATLTVVASAASIMPAIRAARIEPTAALRSE